MKSLQKESTKLAISSLLLTIILCLGFFVSVLASCSLEKTDSATNTTGGNTAGTSGSDGGQNDVAVTDFAVTADTSDEYTFYLSKADSTGETVSTLGTECKANAGEWIHCVLDIEELDLNQHSITFRNTAPGDMCYYRGFQSYYFALAPVGVPPTSVSYSSADGGDTIANLQFNHVNVSSPPTKAADIKCPYDYSDGLVYDKGKNCCEGEYTLTVTNSIDASFTRTKENWGGKYSDCFAGPAISDNLPKSHNGLGANVTTEVIGRGFKDSYTVAAPNKSSVKFLISHGDTNIYAANYYKKSDHNNAMPAPLALGFDNYRFDCLDHNAEVVARIDVRVREWNTRDQLTNLGNPDVTGAEASPFDSGDLLNDFSDWKDVETLYDLVGGHYIGFPQ